MKRGRLFILSGPSGVGKGTVRARLFEKIPGLVYSISCTTRSPREGEIDGVHYRFIDDAAFDSFVREGRFLEWARVHENRYGTLRADVENQLSEGRSVEGCSERLGVHRHTVRNRIQRVTQLLGRSVESVDAQTELWLALKARGLRDT